MFNNFTYTELSHEQWKDIEGYDGMYQVSDLGRVRSLKFGRVKVLRPTKNVYGYLRVGLFLYGKQKKVLVHRLVAQAFIENDDENKTQINHIDECKQNNRLWNLEYCTAQYNMTYNGLQQRRFHPIQDRIKYLYNPNISIKQNIEIFKANGIECCRGTVCKLRRNLNLKGRSNWKRNEIKDLYNPNLSIKENLKVFKENGVECSKNAVVELRRDLGLTKHYRPRKKPN